MTDLSAKVDPNRFIGKSFTRRKSFPDITDDYLVVIDGLVAGRIMKQTLSAQRLTWSWSLTAPYMPPTLQATNGERPTLDEAQESFKAAFWRWHSWAPKQPGMAAWHGAVE